jgi:ABC-2 type transport system ATP-binding protein
VFLSSHILSEVEALCDRVAILRRAGSSRWARWRNCGTCRAHRRGLFDGAPPDLSSVPGVRRVTTTGREVHLEVAGSMEPLLAALAGTAVRQLTSREPSLEELFLAHYGSAADG